MGHYFSRPARAISCERYFLAFAPIQAAREHLASMLVLKALLSAGLSGNA